MELYDSTSLLLEKVLDLRQQKQEVIAANIANATTPGYAPARLEFEDALREAVATEKRAAPATSHPAHFPVGGTSLANVQATVIRSPDQAVLGDRNGVSLDQEMLALTENQLMHETTVQLLNKKLGVLKYVIQNIK